MHRCWFLTLAFLACGGGPGGDEAHSSDGPLLPLTVGARWTYREFDPLSGVRFTKVTTVKDYQPLDGAGPMVYLLESESPTKVSRVYLEAQSDLVVRHREETYYAAKLTEAKVLSPFSLRAPEQLPARSWTADDRYTESTFGPDGRLLKTQDHAYRWVVGALSEQLTVPAGTFETVRLERTSPTGKEKTTWWAPGIGKVKEDELGVVEELAEYSLP